MIYRCTAIIASLTALLWVGAMLAFAQQGGLPRSSVGRVLQRWDSNGNGILEQNEISPRVKSFVDRMARNAGLDPNQPIPLDKFNTASSSNSKGDGGAGQPSSSTIGQQSRDGGAPSRSSDESSARSSSKDSFPMLPGFGEKNQVPQVPGFGLHADSQTEVLEARYTKVVLLYVDRLLKSSDKNGNGILDHDEWQHTRWQGDPGKSDLNKDGRLTKAELCEHFTKQFGRRTGSSAANSSTNASRASQSRFTSSLTSVRFLVRYDANKDGVLHPDEIEPRLRRITDRLVRNAGFDPNKPVKLSELNQAIQSRLTGVSQPAPSGSKPSGDVPEGASYKVEGSKLTGRRSYRFRAPTERLPQRMPPWWNGKDGDGDGQIIMAEFATTWSAAKVAEFARYDLNGDGVITPKEAAGKNRSAPQVAR